MGKKSDSLDWSQATNASAQWATFGKQNWQCGMFQTSSSEAKVVAYTDTMKGVT